VDESFIAEVTFKNKPTQPVKISFLLFETWNVIKARFQKIRDSDGVCVICFEPEKEKDKCASMCETCCEFICLKCIVQNLQLKGGLKGRGCPVCREDMLKYANKLNIFD
jgi:hypothetical protein